jgi:ribosome biogenesis SPOUT family RNA methylase Rps3
MSRIDRTSQLRQKGYAGRRLGPKQMTTDTAVRVTRMVIQEKGMPCLVQGLCAMLAIANVNPVPLDQIPYIDFPELRINKHETVEMPFRYVKDGNGQPIMPEVCREFKQTVLSRKLRTDREWSISSKKMRIKASMVSKFDLDHHR